MRCIIIVGGVFSRSVARYIYMTALKRHYGLNYFSSVLFCFNAAILSTVSYKYLHFCKQWLNRNLCQTFSSLSVSSSLSSSFSLCKFSWSIENDQRKRAVLAKILCLWSNWDNDLWTQKDVHLECSDVYMAHFKWK